MNSEDSNRENGHIDNNDYDSRKKIWCEIFKMRHVYSSVITSKLSYKTSVNNMGAIYLVHTPKIEMWDEICANS